MGILCWRWREHGGAKLSFHCSTGSHERSTLHIARTLWPIGQWFIVSYGKYDPSWLPYKQQHSPSLWWDYPSFHFSIPSSSLTDFLEYLSDQDHLTREPREPDLNYQSPIDPISLQGFEPWSRSTGNRFGQPSNQLCGWLTHRPDLDRLWMPCSEILDGTGLPCMSPLTIQQFWACIVVQYYGPYVVFFFSQMGRLDDSEYWNFDSILIDRRQTSRRGENGSSEVGFCTNCQAPSQKKKSYQNHLSERQFITASSIFSGFDFKYKK